MRSRLGFSAALAALAGAWLAAPAAAEPHYLAKQYTRCATCHYRASGGGLLTPYGRSLSRQEIASFGRAAEGEEAAQGARREEDALYGALSNWLAFDVGVDARPSRLRIERGEAAFSRAFWMRADLQVAVRAGSFTGYGEVGRLPGAEPSFVSREHWVGWESEQGVGLRIGRFQPAFGLNLADHTSFNRRDLGFDQDDQIYGVEISEASETRLLQFFLGPGRAESIYDDDGQVAFTGGGRLQFDLRPKHVLAVSGLFRGKNDFAPAVWLGSVAYGYAPTPRLALWSELDALATRGWKGTPQYVLFHRLSFELTRGLWVHVSPQVITDLANISGGRSRIDLGVQFLPRPHWDINLAWQRERNRLDDTVVKVLVMQLHLYL